MATTEHLLRQKLYQGMRYCFDSPDTGSCFQNVHFVDFGLENWFNTLNGAQWEILEETGKKVVLRKMETMMAQLKRFQKRRASK